MKFGTVLLVSPGGKSAPKVGEPTVKGAEVHAVIEGEQAGDKIRNYKGRRRENYHRRLGHRQHYTRIRITKIVPG